MKKTSLFPLLAFLFAMSVTLLALGMSGCGGGGVTPAPTPFPTPTPTPTPAPESSSYTFASLRSGEPASGSAAAMTRQQLQAARRAAKTEHETGRHAAIPFADQANIYVWSWGDSAKTEGRKINDSPGAYTAVHLEYQGTSIVFSKVIDGYNQIFTSPVPATGQTIDKPLQLTSKSEQHWIPHISADGLKVVFTKADPNSDGDVVCISNAAEAAEKCLDLSSTTPVLKGANIWHASWTPAGKIVFEAWGGSLNSDEIFMVSEDGSALTQLTNNAGTKNYDECPSVSSLDKNELLVDTWNDKTQHFEITSIDLTTRQRHTIAGQDPKADSWDPLENYRYGTLWISQRPSDQSLEIHGMSWGPIQLTHNAYADFFVSSSR